MRPADSRDVSREFSEQDRRTIQALDQRSGAEIESTQYTGPKLSSQTPRRASGSLEQRDELGAADRAFRHWRVNRDGPVLATFVGLGKPVKFTLRTLFVAVFVVAMFLGLAVFVERTWFGLARVGVESQARLDAVFAKHRWQGYAGTWHYDYRIRIVSSDVGDAEMRELYPILHDIHWLKHIELHTASMTDEGLDEMKREFPNCVFTSLEDGR